MARPEGNLEAEPEGAMKDPAKVSLISEILNLCLNAFDFCRH